ncbi:hypothetical protein F4813DRAFT_343340 [Daldinia decipiens]|uniref:uncharacterized protein n=1 Tax=Daldinia decipiens TaxID=326647 RepID=UPI0020C1F94C|nr:uncharacterized protein F4813DRAFT_343340 [Daldinia decipiens]KAI1662066.1 hypothetical protein F4813DRAFT_343340 [Daldinia decipiens]
MAIQSLLSIVPIVLAASSFSFVKAASSTFPNPQPPNGDNCRCFPGDACWPTPTEWSSFNATVGGRLIATTPIAASCHQSNLANYDAQACQALRDVWWFPETHLATPSSPMAPFFANASCDPFTTPTDQCVIGAYVQYAVKAADVADYQATLAFAAAKNIRLVIRNTGHDYFGKSTGAGGLALWTHFLKDTELIDNYESTAYTGKALRLGAGIEALEAYQAADKAGVAIVGGGCSTVGVAGGYSQGGGQGPLNSVFGLGADQVLEWEVVTAGGQHLVASPAKNSDLYWALSGGGGGTYAAVISMTVRVHQLTKVSVATLNFTTSTNVSADLFNSAVQTFLLTLPRLGEAGTWSVWLLATGVFSLNPIVSPDLDKNQLQALLEPTLSFLDNNGIPYNYQIQQYSSFLEAYTEMFPVDNITEYNIGGRLIPKSLLETNSSAASFFEALNFITSQGGVVSGNSLDVSGFPRTGVNNSVNPVWRTTILNIVFGLAYNAYDFQANIALQNEVTNTLMPRLEALTPGGRVYLNEGDFRDPNWKCNFYGANYARLLSIKDKYDPDGLFYGLTAVGSDRWTVQSDGRLCRIS